MERDADALGNESRLAADVCIVGAGPAGLALASGLARSGMQVLVLESGRRPADPEARRLNGGDPVRGVPQDLGGSRGRGLGGTAGDWNTKIGELNYAKFLPLEDPDFEPRDWIPHSGWPFSREHLVPFYRRAQLWCGLASLDHDAAQWSDRRNHPLPFPADSLSSGVYQLGLRSRFTETIPRELAAAPAVTLLCGATVTGFSTAGPRSAQRVVTAQWATFGGKRGTAAATRFVLAAGGIENPRLLLMLLGERPWLGAGFMEHPMDHVLDLEAGAALDDTRWFYALRTVRGIMVAGRIGLSAGVQRAERIPNASIRLIPEQEPELPAAWLTPVARRLIPSRLARRVIAAGFRRFQHPGRPVQRWSVLLDLEQVPSAENRVTLSGRRDALGVPLAGLQWRWTAEEQAQLGRVREAVARELTRVGAGRVYPAPAPRFDPDTHHHMGATRMHRDAAAGVVDPDLRVFGMENLFVAGPSVFPTSGAANPTLTAIALSFRLADLLASP